MGATTPTPKPGRQRTTRPRRAGTTPRPQTPEGQRIGVAHLTAEYWPFARTGGLGEAVSGFATFQAAAGHPTAVLMPLYQLVRETTPSLERTGLTLTVTLGGDRKSTRLNSSHRTISYAVFCLKKKKKEKTQK